MVSAKLPNFRSNGDGSDPYADLDESEIRTEIDIKKEAFIEADIDEDRSRMVRLAKDLAELNDELADRNGGGPTANQFEDAADKWHDIAELVIDGTDPTEQLQTGSGSTNGSSDATLQEGEIPDNIKEFHQGVPETTFDDVGGYDDVKQQLTDKAIDLIENREFFQAKLGLSVLNGLVLTGPPGTGKTLMGKAFAGELNQQLDEDVTLFKIKPGQLKRGVRGESGKLIRGLFAVAKHNQPAVIIFEEIDSLIQDRSDASVQMMQSDRQLVNAFLDEVTEIDTENVITMGTTNRPDILDDAAIRDKRLETMEMGLPDLITRMRIFRIHLNAVPDQYIDWDNIDIGELGMQTNGVAGATIAAIVDDALLTMGLEYKRDERDQPILTQDDLETQVGRKQND